MLQLILHGIGDYFIQNDWMALSKKNKGLNGLLACLVHCITYSLPFLFIGSVNAVIIIFVTHFIIDRTHLIEYALAVKNGVKKTIHIHSDVYPGGISTKRVYNIDNFGFGLERPFAISIWLYIITDNLCHIICNYVALTYF